MLHYVHSAPDRQSQPASFPIGRSSECFSREAKFEDIVRKSTGSSFVLANLFSIGVTFEQQRINWREFIPSRLTKSPRSANMSAEQKQQQE